jgi:CO/xanthine dehydrogenase Mo-binding subunit
VSRALSNSSLKGNPNLDQWVRFNDDRTVTVFSGKVEFGQGIETAIAQIAADELDVSLDRLMLVAGDTAVSPDEWYTAGSQSIEVGGTAMRHVCAEVRGIFLDEAAKRFEVDAGDLRVADGMIHVPGTDVRTSYWELAPDIDLARPFSAAFAPKPTAALAIVGRSAPRRDIPAKVGGAGFIHDLELPGMLHARVVSPPTFGATLATFDEGKVRKLPGVVAVVRNGSFLAVAAEREEQAVKALETATAAARWNMPASIPARMEIADFLTALPAQTSTVHETGTTPATVAQRFSATYSRPYIAHASIGVCAALAVFEGPRLRLWSHTQGPHFLRGQIASVLGLSNADVDVIHCDGAGCYGHNGADDVALDAALVARAVQRPVLLQWTREQELRRSPCGSAMLVKLDAGVDAQGQVVAWRHELWSHTHIKRPGWGEGINLAAAWDMEPPVPVPPAKDMPLPAGGGDRNAIPYYAFPQQQVVYNFIADMPLRVSALRGLGAFANVFAIESMLDEIAASLDVDPVAFRLRHLQDERARAVIQAAAQAAGWTPGAPSDGARGRGIGFGRYKNLSAYCAVVVEIEAAEKLRVRNCWAAVDAGQVVNPDGLVNQVEGGIVQAVSWTLKEALPWTREGSAAHSWEEYPILRFDEVPEIEVVVLNRPDQPGLGAGECAAGPTAAAIGNALFHALGVRARHLPLTPERIAAAMD